VRFYIQLRPLSSLEFVKRSTITHSYVFKKSCCAKITFAPCNSRLRGPNERPGIRFLFINLLTVASPRYGLIKTDEAWPPLPQRKNIYIFLNPPRRRVDAVLPSQDIVVIKFNCLRRKMATTIGINKASRNLRRFVFFTLFVG
jgi:hypothetical protein